MAASPELAERLADVEAAIADACRAAGRPRDAVTLVAVSKRHPDAAVRALHALGVRDFGENLVQPWLARLDALADLDARWHLIGPVQSNKARRVAEARPHLLHTLDRAKLADALARGLADADDPPLDCLVQVDIDDEPQKSGVAPADLDALADRVADSPHLRLRGLMCIPRPAADVGHAAVRAAFARLRALGERVADRVEGPVALSMGMSDDFADAIAEGATIIRVGTALFGPRPG